MFLELPSPHWALSDASYSESDLQMLTWLLEPTLSILSIDTQWEQNSAAAAQSQLQEPSLSLSLSL